MTSKSQMAATDVPVKVILAYVHLFFLMSRDLFTSARWSWWRPPPRWSCAWPSLCRWSCPCRRSHCRWSRPCQQCGAPSYCGLLPHWSDLKNVRGREIRSLYTCKVRAVWPVKSAKKHPALWNHLAWRAHPTGRSTPPWTGWLRSGCRLHRSRTGWWCCAAQGCARLSIGPRGYETLYSGRCRWLCHPEGKTNYNLKSHDSLLKSLFYWLYYAVGLLLTFFSLFFKLHFHCYHI